MSTQNVAASIGRLSAALKKKSILKLSVWMYLIGIFVTALVLLFSFYLREKSRAEFQLQQQNDALIAAAQSVDAELSSCCSTIAQFINNPNLKKYASASGRDMQAEVELTYYIYLSATNNPDLANYYLYYPNTNVILSAHSAARIAQNSPFYAVVQAYTNQEVNVYSIDVDGRIGFLFPFESHFYIAYEIVRGSPAMAFAELDLSSIFSPLPEALYSSRNAFYIMDPAGGIIHENTSTRLQTLLSDGNQYTILSGQAQHISQFVSSMTGWTFYYTTPKTTGTQLFCSALVSSLPFQLCLLALAVIVYLFFKRQVIQPLHGIIRQSPVELPQQTENELSLLQYAREQLLERTNSHASMLARMRPEILNQIFLQLLHGDAFDPAEMQAILSDLGLQYQFNDRIVVLLLQLPEQQRSEMRSLLPQFVEKLGWDSSRTHLLLGNSSNAYLFLIVHPDESVLSINESCTASFRSSIEQSQITDVPVCSCICYSLFDLHSANDYLLEQLCRVPQQAESLPAAAATYLPFEKKMQAHLKAAAEQIQYGNLDLAQKTILQLLHDNLREGHGLFRNDLIAALLDQLFLVFSVSTEARNRIGLSQKIGSAEPISDADCEELLRLAIQLCRNCYLKSQNKYILEAKKLVQEQYDDPTLSLTSVAEALCIHPNYLSKLFKTSINLNFVDYLRNYRVEKSKELLDTTALSINAIASQAGFSSSHSFIRVFKASFGETPGQYRKQNTLSGHQLL